MDEDDRPLGDDPGALEPWPFPRFSREYPPPGPPPRPGEQREAALVKQQRDLGVPPPRRNQRLSRAEIVRAAIAVADAEGPDAISMRRIARELRSGAMSLYWHVGSKEELLDLMLTTLEDEVVMPEPSGDWRADLRSFACQVRAGMLRHPWAIEFIGSRPPAAPADARNLERVLGTLDGHGLTARASIDIIGTVVTYVLGAVVREGRERRGERDQQRAQAGLSPEQLDEERKRYRDWFRASGRYPRIVRLMDEGVDPDDPATRDERFEFGLDRVLDGIAALLAASGPRPV
ncbi:MAG: TetR/AcrR family transcriptional regulator [Streptosporangiaceae bacterium]